MEFVSTRSREMGPVPAILAGLSAASRVCATPARPVSSVLSATEPALIAAKAHATRESPGMVCAVAQRDGPRTSWARATCALQDIMAQRARVKTKMF